MSNVKFQGTRRALAAAVAQFPNCQDENDEADFEPCEGRNELPEAPIMISSEFVVDEEGQPILANIEALNKLGITVSIDGRKWLAYSGNEIPRNVARVLVLKSGDKDWFWDGGVWRLEAEQARVYEAYEAHQAALKIMDDSRDHTLQIQIVPPPGDAMPVCYEVFARVSHVNCPQCGDPVDGWVVDPRGRPAICDTCSTNFTVSATASVHIR